MNRIGPASPARHLRPHFATMSDEVTNSVRPSSPKVQFAAALPVAISPSPAVGRDDVDPACLLANRWPLLATFIPSGRPGSLRATSAAKSTNGASTLLRRTIRRQRS